MRTRLVPFLIAALVSLTPGISRSTVSSSLTVINATTYRAHLWLYPTRDSTPASFETWLFGRAKATWALTGARKIEVQYMRAELEENSKIVCTAGVATGGEGGDWRIEYSNNICRFKHV